MAETKERPATVRPRAIPELLLVTVLFLAYKVGRILADGHVGRAFDDARDVWRLERFAHLPSEVDVQHAMLSSGALTHAANAFYAWAHFPVSAGFLLWIYIRRPERYVPLRRLMSAVTCVALATHAAFPLAPPRMLPDIGLIDTAARFGPSVYGPPATDTLSNQYAAMPSLHVGWALIVAVGLIGATRGRWRRLWLLHPAVTFVVVVGTANHYWLDGLVAIAIVAAFLPLLRAAGPPVTATRAAEPAPATAAATLAAAVVLPKPRTAQDRPVDAPVAGGA